jgi:hypothetical protein
MSDKPTWSAERPVTVVPSIGKERVPTAGPGYLPTMAGRADLAAPGTGALRDGARGLGGAGTLIRLGWHPFPLTPALSLREKGNHRLTSWNPTIPVVEWLTVHGQGELPEGSHEYGGTGGRMSIGKSGGGPPHSRTLRAVGWSQAHMAAV